MITSMATTGLRGTLQTHEFHDLSEDPGDAESYLGRDAVDLGGADV